MPSTRGATIRGLRTTWWYLAASTMVLAVMAAGVHTTSITAPALAEQERSAREAEAAAERAVVANPAASDGLPVPALIGGIVLAFTVGLTAGHVQRRRRGARRREALLRPAPVADRPVAAKPAPRPPEPPAPSPPKRLSIAPAPAPPAPPPPEPPKAVAPPPPPPPPPPPQPAPAPPLPFTKGPAPEPEPEPEPEPVAEPEPEPEPVAETKPEPEAPPAPAKAPGRRRKPKRKPRRRPDGSPARGPGPEVPRPADGPPSTPEPALPLAGAPEAVGTPARPPMAHAVPARRFARARPWPKEAETLWTCEIAWKAGYVKSTFRAMAGPPGGEGRRRPICESPPLRWTLMTDPEPPTPEMMDNVRALVRALVAAGWERTEPGGAWFAQRFVWRGEGEPRPVEAPKPQESAEPPSR